MKKMILLAFFALILSINAFAHQAFTLVSSELKTIKAADLAALEKGQTMGKKNKTMLTFTESEIRLVVTTGPGEDMLSYRIQDIRNPTLVVPSGTMLKILFVNVDDDMKHDVRFGHVIAEFISGPDTKETTGADKLPPKSENGEMQAEEIVLKANADGVYKYFCSVGGHAKGGMWGNIAVGVKPDKNMKLPVQTKHIHSADEDNMDNMPGMKKDDKTPIKKPGDMSDMPGMKKVDKKPDDMSAMDMDPYFSSINYTLPRDSMMVMLLSDYQSARTGPNFFTGMGMVEYGVTSRWTVGAMFEGEKIKGLPAAYGGFRVNTYFKVLPHDHVLNFTVYGEYEGLNGAALYKMEVAGFGGEDLVGPLPVARRTPVRTLELRAIVYHDWGRTNFTFNFISETPLEHGGGNDFGYTWGVFRKPAYMPKMTDKSIPGMSMQTTKAPPALSFKRLGYGVEMIGALGDNHHFGFDWQNQQHYIGPVFSYVLSKKWTLHVEPAFGLSAVSDPFMLRMGIGYSIDHLFHRP